jgi:hypothetical protein
MAIVDLVEQVPDELLPIDASDYSHLMVGLSAIRHAISRWQAGDYSVTSVPGYDNLNPLTLIHQALSTCPDESPSLATTDLHFIPDQQLRDNLRMDISATNSALANGEWKAATVLAGSVIESLLLWALQQRPQTDITTAVSTLTGNGTLVRNPGNQIETWTLVSYIEVALELNIIDTDTATQVRLAKDFRNLIHPGRALRLRQTCDRATALSAVAAMEHIVRCLTP